MLQHQVGTFQEGKEFDALLVDVNAEGGPFDVFDGDTLEDQFEKFINLGDDRNIVEVYVQGVRVKQGDEFAGKRTDAIHYLLLLVALVLVMRRSNHNIKCSMVWYPCMHACEVAYARPCEVAYLHI